LLQRAEGFLVSTSDLVRRVAAPARNEVAAFEREAAIAKTAPAMSPTPPDVLKVHAPKAELVDRLTFAHFGDGFRVELRGGDGGGMDGTLSRAEFQRILLMLLSEARKAQWIAGPAAPQPVPAPDETTPKTFRH
jgi:hypothetical protein